MGNIIVGQSGGPTAVINASLAGVYSAARKNNFKIYGMINGIEGLLNRKYVELSEHIKSDLDINILKLTPSSFLGSCRYKLPKFEENTGIYEEVFKILKELNIDKFFYIGGNDSMDTISKLQDYASFKKIDIKFIGIPKTIDNDLAVTDHTPGFGSACKYIATTIKEIIRDATVYDTYSVTIVEVMGRNAGWLTASAAICRGQDCEGVDLIYLPEVSFDVETFVNKVKTIFKTKKSIVVAVSEGIKNKNGVHICEIENDKLILDNFGHKYLGGTASVLSNILKKRLKCKTRAIEINTSQRCAGHVLSETDINESFLAGVYALDFAIKGETGKVVIFEREENSLEYKINYKVHNVKDIAIFEKTVPIEWIDTENTYVKQPILDYILPLIKGEIYPIMLNGLPLHLKLK